MSDPTPHFHATAPHFIHRWVTDLLENGDTDALWYRFHRELGGLAARTQDGLKAQVKAAYTQALERQERNALLQEIWIAQHGEGLV